MPTYSTAFGGSPIKSIQRGSVTISSTPQNVTISAVTTSKAVESITYIVSGSSIEVPSCFLSSSTTLTFNAASTGATVRWIVKEYI